MSILLCFGDAGFVSFQYFILCIFSKKPLLMIIKLSPAHFNMFYFVFFMFGWKINASDEFVIVKLTVG